jgi:hypothetical protein
MKSPLHIVFAIQIAFAALSAGAPIVITAPTVITQSGSYILGNNILAVSSPAITIANSGVSIDFNGYSITGLGVLYGVFASGQNNISLQNGSIVGFTRGINLASTSGASHGHIITHMNITSGLTTGTVGIFIGTAVASRISDCEVSNQAFGIYTLGNVNVLQNDVSGSTNTGIRMSPGDFAERNTVSNSLFGILGGKFQNNLTSGCTTPFSNGIDAGGNN